jgi:thioredoxin 1
VGRREDFSVATPIDVTDTSFDQEVLRADKAVLVDFWAPWCGPCRALAPVLAELAEERQDQLKVVKVNVDEHQQYAAQLRVMTVPSLVLFKDGEAIEKVNGALPRRAISALLDQHLGAKAAPAVPVAQG